MAAERTQSDRTKPAFARPRESGDQGPRVPFVALDSRLRGNERRWVRRTNQSQCVQLLALFFQVALSSPEQSQSARTKPNWKNKPKFGRTNPIANRGPMPIAQISDRHPESLIENVCESFQLVAGIVPQNVIIKYRV